MASIYDLHTHSEASEDSRAPVEAYLNWIKLKRSERPLTGVVLTEHRQFNRAADYRVLEDKYEIRILKATEAETDYGHMLVFGVNDDIAQRFDFANIRIPAQELIDEVARMGGVVVPCHPGRPTVGLCEHYAAKPPLEHVVAVELLNGGSRRGEDERTAELVNQFNFRTTGGSDSHLVSLIGICATRFEADIRDMDHLVAELKAGAYAPVDFRPARKPVPSAMPDSSRT